MKNFTFVFINIFLLLITSKSVYSQNSLYLVDTLTGTSPNNKLLKAEGIGDFNGDGYADFIVCYSQYVDLYFGNAQFKPQMAHRFYLPYQASQFEGSAYAIGDVNGDGYSDLMIITGDTTYSPIYPYCEIILGGKELDTIPKFTYFPPYYWDMGLSDGIYPLGDLNHDGYNDFAIASPYNWYDGLGRVYIFKGGKTLIDTPWIVLKTTIGTETHFFGTSVLGIGDYNGDGYDDFLITDPTLPEDSDKVYLYLGNKDSIISTPNKTFGPYKDFTEVKPAGDIDGDGKKDFIISADDTVRIYLGNTDQIIYDATKLGTGGYVAVGTGGDINHDGYDDFLIGNTNYRNSDSIMVGEAIGFWGGKPLSLNSEAFYMEGNQKWFEYGKSISIAGDINGDGYSDIFILQPSYCKDNIYNYDSTLGRLYIYSYIKITNINSKGSNTTTDFKLNQNYPNPFNPSTTISYQIPSVSYVTLKIFDALGQEIANLANNELQSSGEHSLEFNAGKYNLSSGIYFFEMNYANINSHIYNYQKVIKMIYLK